MLRNTISRNSRNLTRGIKLYSTEPLNVNVSGFDQFNQREKAKENLFIRNHEKEQLNKLREQIKQHKEKIKHLENQINEISNNNSK